MPANYSTNPTNPAGQNGGPMANPAIPQQPMDPTAGTPQQPKNIRDYLALARSRSQVPMFTNQPGDDNSWNPETGQVASQGVMAPQAIPEGPQSEYEKMPRGQRMKINPYIRAQERVKTFLPELWNAMFPGMEPGSGLGEADLEKWNGAVQALTGNLLKKFDKEYEWSLKNEQNTKNKRDKDELMWQKFYADKDTRGDTPRNPETQMPLSPAEFVEQQMAISDEMKFNREMADKERNTGTIADYDANQIGKVLQKHPDLGRMIKEEILSALSQQEGRQITDGDFNAMRKDPMQRDKVNQAAQQAIQNHGDEIMQYMNK